MRRFSLYKRYQDVAKLSHMTDWIAMRKALTVMRKATLLKDATFARKAGMDRATVRRVENTEEEPDYEPSMKTIEKWLRAAEKSGSAADFLTRFNTITLPVTDETHTLQTEQKPLSLVEDLPDAVVVAGASRLVSDLTPAEASFLQRIGLILYRAGEVALVQSEDKHADETQADRRKTLDRRRR